MSDAEITDLLFLRDPLARSDLAIVFGHHEPAVCAERASHAASLYLGGYTPLLLLTGGVTGEAASSEAGSMADTLLDLGVPQQAMLLEARSRTTAENFTLSVRLLACENLLDSLRVVHFVSCAFHMKRLTLLGRNAFGPDVQFLCSPHDSGCTASTWTSSPICRERVRTEARLVSGLLRS